MWGVGVRPGWTRGSGGRSRRPARATQGLAVVSQQLVVLGLWVKPAACPENWVLFREPVVSRGQALATCFETLSNFCRSSRGYWGDRGQGGVAGSPEPGSVSQAGRSWLPGPRLMLSVTAVALPVSGSVMAGAVGRRPSRCVLTPGESQQKAGEHLGADRGTLPARCEAPASASPAGDTRALTGGSQTAPLFPNRRDLRVVFVEARSMTSLAIGDPLNRQPLSPPRRGLAVPTL